MSKAKETSPQAIKLEARAYPIAEPMNNTLAYATVTINDVFAVKGIRVMNSEKGKFAAMPSMRDKSGEYREVCHPITGDFRKKLNSAVLVAYEAAIERAGQDKSSVLDGIKEGTKADREKNSPFFGKPPKKPEPEL